MKPAPDAPIPVAIVEDDAEVRASLVAFVTSSPRYVCAGAYANAEHALAALARQPARVILVDVNLPGLNGVECVRRLSDLQPHALKMMLTVHQDANTIYEALAAGASGYLLKPVRREELLEAIAELLRGGSPMTSSIARKVVQSFRQPPPPADPPLPQLSERELAILQLITEGFIYKEIAQQLGISFSSVATYVQRVYTKLHVRSRHDLVVRFKAAHR